MDTTLNTGSVAQTVQVNANALQVDTSDTRLKATVTSEQIEQLPLLGRDASILQKGRTGSPACRF